MQIRGSDRVKAVPSSFIRIMRNRGRLSFVALIVGGYIVFYFAFLYRLDDNDENQHNFLPSLFKYRTEDENPLHLEDGEIYSNNNNYYSNNITSKAAIDFYLKITTTVHNEDTLFPIPDERKLELENIFRSGIGLQPHTTDRGEAAWVENGVIIRPWRKTALSKRFPNHPKHHSPEYEAFIPFNESTFFEGRQPDLRYKTGNKIILWHKPTRYTADLDDLKPMRGCPNFPCYITTNRLYTNESAALVFAAQIMDRKPPQRRPEQVFVLHNHEPPYTNSYYDKFWKLGFKQRAWKSAFNWTMTYRVDSDIPAFYGLVRKRPAPLINKDYEAIVAKKTRKVAWLVSNCNTPSKRKQYIKELRKYIDVDIYGKCGDFKCPHAEDYKCSEMISRDYKFYLAFESAICPDYVTEKFFHYLNMDTIVVARGSDEYFQQAPRDIFINAASFPSPRELAKKMHYLDSNDQEYIKMLKTKDEYTILEESQTVRDKSTGFIKVMSYHYENVAFCQLCQRLWNLDRHSKTIPNIHAWFDRKICRPPSDVDF